MMPRWYGDPDVAGRAGKTAMLWAIRKVMGLFSAGVIVVRTHPSDDEYDTLGVEFGDPAICDSLMDEYAGKLPEGVGCDDDDDEEYAE